ncbi:MAG: oligosaccharide flippase family protein [PVC group bacterium]|nr:oligosaccharide flippase family protein [PVC group bacterium]
MFNYFKQFLKHSALYGIGNILTRVASFILLPLYTRALMPAEYGTLEMFHVTTAILRALLGMMIAHATLRFYFEYKEEIERKRVISTAMIFSFVACALVLACLGRFTNQLSHLVFGTQKFAGLFYIVFCIVVMELSKEISFAFLRAKEKSLLYISIAVLQLFLQLGLNLFMVLKLRMGIKGILIGNMISIAVVWLVLSTITFKWCGFNFHWPKLKALLHYSFPIVVSALFGIVIQNSDRVLLSRYAGLSALGLYALSRRFGLAVRYLIIEPFNTNFGASRFAVMKEENSKQIYARTMTYFAYVLIFFSLAATLFSRELLMVMSAEEYRSAYKVVPFIMLHVIFRGLQYIFQTGVLIKKKTMYILYIKIIAAAIIFCAAWVLIPMFGLYGAAIAVALTSLFYCAATWYISHKFYPVDYEFDRLFKILAITILIYTASLLFVGMSLGLTIGIKLILLSSFPVLLNLSGFYKPGEKKTYQEYKGKIFNVIKQKVLRIK